MKSRKFEIAVSRLINNVWSVVFERLADNKVRIYEHSPTVKEGYEREDNLQNFDLIETSDSDRTVVLLELGKQEKQILEVKERLAVENPKNVFGYKDNWRKNGELF